MKTIYHNGTIVKYSFTSEDGGVESCFTQMALNPALIHIESYKDNEILLPYTFEKDNDLIVQSGALKISAPFKNYGTIKILSGATLHLAADLTVGFTASSLVDPLAQCNLEVYDGATLILDNCSLKSLFGSKLRIHKYATVVFQNATASLKVVPTAVTTFNGRVETTTGEVSRDWETAPAVESDWIDPVALITLINGSEGFITYPYTFTTSVQEEADAEVMVDDINYGTPAVGEM